MNDFVGKFVTQRPGLAVAVILITTIIFGAINSTPEIFGLEKNQDESEDSFLPDNEVANANRKIQDEFGVQVSYMQILVQGKNVVERDALIDTLEVEWEISNDTKVQAILFPGPGNMVSIASVTARGYAGFMLEMDPANATLDPNNMTYAEMWEVLSNPMIPDETFDQVILGAQNDDQNPFKPAMFLTKGFGKNIARAPPVVKAKGSMILIQLNSSMYDEIDGDNNPVLDADMEVLDIIENKKYRSVDRMGLIEAEYISYAIEEQSGDVMGQLFMGVFALIVIILFITYRSIFDTVVSLMGLMFAITWMNGIGVILGLTFGTMSDAVPIMIMGLGIDYAIHIVMRYREERIHYDKGISDSLSITVTSVGMALLLATITTSVSFGSNMVSEIQPMREFAIFSFVGIISAFLSILIFVPAIKQLFHTFQKKRGRVEFKNKRPAHATDGQFCRADGKKNGVEDTGSASMLSKLLAKGAIAAEHHAYPVIAVVIVISIIAAGLSTQLTTEFDFTEFLPEGAEISEDIIYMTDNFAFGTEESAILIEGDIATPEVMIAINDTHRRIEDDRYINEQDPIESILTLMKETAYGTQEREADPVFAGMYNASLNQDGIPTRNLTVLFDYLRTHDDHSFDMVRVMHYDERKGEYDAAVIRVAVNSENGARSKEIFEDMNADAEPLENVNGVDRAIATGGPVLIHHIIRSIELSGIYSLIITVVVAGIILTMIFWITEKSLALGLLTEIPVLLVIAWVFAGMYVIGMPLNVMTIMIASLTVGLGITYGIHVTHRFAEDLKECGDVDSACRSTVVNTGTALFGAAVTTIGGFGILILAPIPPMKKFGAITALAISFSLIASVFVLPTFLSVWAKYVLRKDPERWGGTVEEPGPSKPVRGPKKTPGAPKKASKTPKKIVRKPVKKVKPARDDEDVKEEQEDDAVDDDGSKEKDPVDEEEVGDDEGSTEDDLDELLKI